METIKLKVDRRIYDNLMWLLRQFKPEDLEIIPDKENENFLQEKKYLDEQLKLIDSGRATFISLDEFNKRMEKRIKKYESRDS